MKQIKQKFLWVFGILTISLFIIIFFRKTQTYNITINPTQPIQPSLPNSKIPNIIWSFWDGEPPELIKKCIKSWKYYNPKYEIRILNKHNYTKYIEQNIDNIKHSNDSLARYSDYIRLAVLSKYGGIWIDASIICHMPFDWIHGYQQSTNCEMIGYYLDSYTKPEYLYTSPVIESWFFACIPNSRFMVDWCNEFYRTAEYSTIDNYIIQLKKDKIDLQKIEYLNYLAIHCAAQKVLQTHLHRYNLVLFSAISAPYKYLEDANWEPSKAMERLTNDSTRTIYYKLPIIKLRSRERNIIDKYDISKMFSNN